MGFRRAVALALGFIFVAAGITKVVPVEPLSGKMVSDFKSYVKVCPLKHFGVKVDAEMYRTLTGVLEIAMGVLLAFGRSDASWFSAIGLLVIMVVAAYTLICLEKPPAEIAVPVAIACVIFWLLFGDNRY